jgi:hypothetical protein
MNGCPISMLSRDAVPIVKPVRSGLERQVGKGIGGVFTAVGGKRKERLHFSGDSQPGPDTRTMKLAPFVGDEG